jgi:hypothetical protein
MPRNSQRSRWPRRFAPIWKCSASKSASVKTKPALCGLCCVWGLEMFASVRLARSWLPQVEGVGGTTVH